MGGTVIVNQDAFVERNLAKAGYVSDPLEDGSLDNYTLFKVPMTTITKEVCKDLGVKPRDAERSKNFFALGLLTWLYSRPSQPTLDWISAKFKSQQLIADANTAAFKAGMAFGETAPELFDFTYEVKPAPAGAGDLYQREREHRLVVGPGCRQPAGQGPPVLGLLPHHPGQRHPPRAEPAQEFRGPHLSRPRMRSPQCARR